ncbi:MAG: hypothetical protein MHM6MM_001744 [Cercozoa sp. M6MM]
MDSIASASSHTRRRPRSRRATLSTPTSGAQSNVDASDVADSSDAEFVQDPELAATGCDATHAAQCSHRP